MAVTLIAKPACSDLGLRTLGSLADIMGEEFDSAPRYTGLCTLLH